MNSAMVFISVSGSAHISVETDGEAKEYVLKQKTLAVYVTLGSWIRAFDISAYVVLMGVSYKRYQDCVYISYCEKYKNLMKEHVI